jgi:hypothetical protein
VDVFFSNWYGIILILWGLVFEIGGAIAMVGIYRWTQRDQRQMRTAAIEALGEQPALAASGEPTTVGRELPRRAA